MEARLDIRKRRRAKQREGKFPNFGMWGGNGKNPAGPGRSSFPTFPIPQESPYPDFPGLEFPLGRLLSASGSFPKICSYPGFYSQSQALQGQAFRDKSSFPKPGLRDKSGLYKAGLLEPKPEPLETNRYFQSQAFRDKSGLY